VNAYPIPFTVTTATGRRRLEVGGASVESPAGPDLQLSDSLSGGEKMMVMRRSTAPSGCDASFLIGVTYRSSFTRSGH
jgi:hypothetical protein